MAYDLCVAHRVLLYVDYLARCLSLWICLILLLSYRGRGLYLNRLRDWPLIRHLHISVILAMLPPLSVSMSRLLIIFILNLRMLVLSSRVTLKLLIMQPLWVLRLGEIDLFHSGSKYHAIVLLNTPVIKLLSRWCHLLFLILKIFT
jgi:hypothetical protein